MSSGNDSEWIKQEILVADQADTDGHMLETQKYNTFIAQGSTLDDIKDASKEKTKSFLAFLDRKLAVHQTLKTLK